MTDESEYGSCFFSSVDDKIPTKISIFVFFSFIDKKSKSSHKIVKNLGFSYFLLLVDLEIRITSYLEVAKHY
jgi:hypothetical protein